MYMGRSLHTYVEHRNLKIQKKTRNDFFVQVRNFLLPLSLKVFRHKEWEAQSFYSGFFICTRNTCDTKVSASKRKRTVFPRGRSHLNSLTFSKSPKILRALPVRDVIRAIPVSHLGLLWHLWVTRPLRPHARTPVLMLHPSNPCTEPKRSQPN